MKYLTILLIAISALLSGCVAYDVPYRDGNVYRSDHDRNGPPNRGYQDHDRNGPPNHGYQDHGRNGPPDHGDNDHDRDGDGIQDRQDSRPNDPRRN